MVTDIERDTYQKDEDECGEDCKVPPEPRTDVNGKNRKKGNIKNCVKQDHHQHRDASEQVYLPITGQGYTNMCHWFIHNIENCAYLKVRSDG